MGRNWLKISATSLTLSLATLSASAQDAPASSALTGETGATAASDHARVEDYRLIGGENAIFSITLENDYFVSTDRNYTNGVRAAYVSAPKKTRGFSGFIAEKILRADDNYGMRVSWALGQSIFTPEDFEERAPLPDQHPYAGWLYLEHGVIAVKRKSISRLVTQMGVVGPSAGGEWAQNSVHRVQGGAIAEGWENQLRDEFGFTLTYERGRVVFDTPTFFGLESDAVGLIGGTAGNVITEGKFGGMLRFGRNLSADAGPPRIRPALAGGGFFDNSAGNSWYVFVGAQARAVAWNIFLDGNTFEGDREPQVERIPVVGEMQVGAVARFGRTQLSYQIVARTEEFETQDDNQVFGALSVAVAF